MGKSSAKRSMRAQARAQAHALVRAQGDGEIKCKKVNARTGMHTG